MWIIPPKISDTHGGANPLQITARNNTCCYTRKLTWSTHLRNRQIAMGTCLTLHITMTSQWAPWRLKSPPSPLFTQPFIGVQIEENIKAPRQWPSCGEFTQRASNAENVSIWWRHHEVPVVYKEAQTVHHRVSTWSLLDHQKAQCWTHSRYVVVNQTLPLNPQNPVLTTWSHSKWPA